MGIYLSEEATSPGTPPSGTQRLYPKADGKWYTKQDDGTETEVSLAGHTHAAGDVTNGILAADRLPTVPLAKGGTGATTAAAARAALGADDAANLTTGTLQRARLPAQLAGVSTGSMSNNTAVSFATDGATGFLLLHTVTTNSSYAELLYFWGLYCTDSSSQYLIALNSGSYVETTTGSLNGTSGTDGMLTLSAASGSLYVENRTHMTLEYVVTMIGQA